MTDKNYLLGLRQPSPQNPLRILMSACLSGQPCGYDATSYGHYPLMHKLLGFSTVKAVKFCPENFAFGTPRELCDIHGGTGADVLDGKARVLTETGKDWTDGMIAAAGKMLEIAKAEKIELAILMDVSAACGSQVIYAGNRNSTEKRYQIGAGVCAANLTRNGIRVISQRDFKSIEISLSKIDPGHLINAHAKDHDESDWYKEYFGR